MQNAKFFLNKLQVNSINVQTNITFDKINLLVTKYNSCANYSFI